MKSIVLVSMCVVSSCALLWPSHGLAQEKGGAPSADAHAKEAFKKGEALFRAGRYLEALAQFSGGYELSQRPLFLFNMGECARKLGQTERARDYYERYVAADKGGKLVALAEKRITELGGRAPEATTDARDAPAEDAPAPAKELAPVQSAPAAVAAQPEPSVPAAALRVDDAEEEPRPLWKKWPFWAAVGAAAVTTTVVVFATTSDGGGCTGTCVDFRD